MKASTASYLCVFVAVTASAGSPEWPTSGWPRSTPEAHGMNQAALEALDREFAQGQHGYVDGMLVVRNGHVVFERAYEHDYHALFEGRGEPGIYNYYDPAWHPYYRDTRLHTMQSVTKSVTSALVGIALGRGEIKALDESVLPYFEGYRVPEGDARRDRLTLRHLLTMTAGIEWDESTVTYTDPRNSCALMEASDDWVQFVLAQPMAAEPGSTYVYSSGVTELLAQILKKATGEHVDSYAEKHLFGPLGITEYYWKKTPTGHPDTEGGLYLTPDSLARIGLLYLHDGVWNGKRLLPEGWVRDSTAPAVDASPGDEADIHYGFQWWVLPWSERGEQRWAAACRGYGGQILLVVPEHDLLAVFTGWNIYGQPSLASTLALQRVLAAVAAP